MAKQKTQADIVNKVLEQQGRHVTVTDKVRLPGLEYLFIKPKIGDVVSDRVIMPDLKTLGTKPRSTIAEILTNALQYHPGITEIEWIVGDSHMTISYIEGFRQAVVQQEEDTSKIINILTMVLKSRPNFAGVKWELGSSFIELSYVLT